MNIHLISALICSLTLMSCAGNKNILSSKILKEDFLARISADPEHEVQIIYTRVDRKNKKFFSSTFQVDPKKYFYPASTVKMPVAILSLQRLNELKREGIDINKNTDMLTAAFRQNQIPAFVDSTTVSKKPNIERYIEKIFAVSDNDAYNRLYEFLGQDYINETLLAKGAFTNSVINHRLERAGLTPEDNRYTNNIRFFKDKKVVYDKPEAYAAKEWRHQAAGAVKGIGYLNTHDSLVNQPFDFSGKNFYSLRDMEGTLQRVFFPEYFAPEQRFDLTEEDLAFLRHSMSALPREYPFYQDNPAYYDSYVKFFMFGDSKGLIPDEIRIYNKVGTAYGYLIDCAYIENKSRDVGFFLTAVISVNRDRIYNDGKYEYEQTGLPFLARLGRSVYEYELKAK